MRLRLSSFVEQLRSSLFFVPMLGVVLGGVLGQGLVYLDSNLDQNPGDLPLGVASTVASARSLLSTIAGATITIAGIAFSISLLIIQLASSQYSPRIVHTMFRDPFTKRVMALVAGTFVYCLMVLRSVRDALGSGGDAVVPNVSVAVGLVLGVATIIGIVAYINHSAHSMDVSRILESVREEAMDEICLTWAETSDDHDPDRVVDADEVLDTDQRADPDDSQGDGSDEAGASDDHGDPGDHRDDDEADDAVDDSHRAEADFSHRPSCVLSFDRSGWVQQIDIDALLHHLPEGATMQVETYAGRYAVAGTAMCTVSPPPPDRRRLKRQVSAAFGLGNTRTLQQDASYGLRQLADVALKALSPGINDPTTAQDAIFHATAVLGELLRRDPPPNRHTGKGGRLLLLPERHTHADMVTLTYGEIRRAAASQPRVCIYLLESIDLLVEALRAEGLGRRTRPLLAQAQLIVAGIQDQGLLPADVELVERAYRHRFEAPARA